MMKILKQTGHILRCESRWQKRGDYILKLTCWTTWVCVALVLCTGLLAACSSSPAAPPATPTPSAYQTTSTTSDGMLDVHFTVSPDYPGTNQFTVSVTEAGNGQAVTQASVTLFTTMLTMIMGTDNIPMQSDGKGHFTASGLLSMNGSWQIRIAIRTPDQVLHEASVQFTTHS